MIKRHLEQEHESSGLGDHTFLDRLNDGCKMSSEQASKLTGAGRAGSSESGIPKVRHPGELSDVGKWSTLLGAPSRVD